MKKLLLFDDFLVNRSDGTRRVFKEPAWRFDLAFCDPASPRGIVGTSVVPAPDGGYCLFYTTVSHSDAFRDENMVVCFARSEDGLGFYNGRIPHPPDAAQPHILGRMSDPIGQWVYLDPHETNAEHRYKAPCARFGRTADGTLAHCPPVVIASPDALNWHPYTQACIVPTYPDCFISLIHNPLTGRYQATTRRMWGERRLFQVESDTLEGWDPPRAILHTSPLDEPTTHLYGMPQCYLEDSELFVGMLRKQIMPFGRIMEGPAWTEYAYSYDGRLWNRTWAPILSLRSRGLLGAGRNYVFTMLEEGEEVRCYANVCMAEHGGPYDFVTADGSPACAVIPGILRRDRFVCVDSGKGTGELLTVPLQWQRPGVWLNLCAPFGRVAARILDGEGPLEGFDYADCCAVEGDRLAFPLSWRGGEVPARRWLRLQIRFEQAEIYAISGDFRYTLNVNAPGSDRL